MPANGASARKMSESRTQLLCGAGLAALLALLFFGKPLAGVQTPLGVDLGDAMILVIDVLWLAAILWKSVSPPKGRDAWFLAAYMPLLPLMQLLTVARTHPPIIATCGFIVAVAAVVGSLSIMARHLWGAR